MLQFIGKNKYFIHGFKRYSALQERIFWFATVPVALQKLSYLSLMAQRSDHRILLVLSTKTGPIFLRRFVTGRWQWGNSGRSSKGRNYVIHKATSQGSKWWCEQTGTCRYIYYFFKHYLLISTTFWYSTNTIWPSYAQCYS